MFTVSESKVSGPQILKNSAKGHSILREETAACMTKCTVPEENLLLLTFMRHNGHPLVKNVDSGTRESWV